MKKPSLPKTFRGLKQMGVTRFMEAVGVKANMLVITFLNEHSIDTVEKLLATSLLGIKNETWKALAELRQALKKALLQKKWRKDPDRFYFLIIPI